MERAGLVLLLAATVGGCGGSSEPSEDRIAREREEAAASARQAERLRGLESQLREERGGGSGNESGADLAPSAPTPPSESSPDAGPTACGGGLSVGPNTTCVFAQAVRDAYERSVGSGSGTVEAYSQATDQSYSMSCSDSPHRCTGGNNASVYFP